MAFEHRPYAAGRRRHTVVLQNPGPLVIVDGEQVVTWMDATPRTWQVAIEPATARDLERVTAGTVLAMASHVVTGPYRADVTTQTRILFGIRVLNVLGVSNPEEKNVETIATATEVVT